MNLFGIPIFVTTNMITNFLVIYFPEVLLSPNELFFVFLAVNGMYLWFYLRVLGPILYKALMFVVNHVF